MRPLPYKTSLIQRVQEQHWASTQYSITYSVLELVFLLTFPVVLVPASMLVVYRGGAAVRVRPGPRPTRSSTTSPTAASTAAHDILSREPADAARKNGCRFGSTSIISLSSSSSPSSCTRTCTHTRTCTSAPCATASGLCFRTDSTMPSPSFPSIF